MKGITTDTASAVKRTGFLEFPPLLSNQPLDLVEDLASLWFTGTAEDKQLVAEVIEVINNAFSVGLEAISVLKNEREHRNL